MTKSEKLIKAEQRVAKWELALEQVRNRDLSKKSYFYKEAKKHYCPERDGESFEAFAESKAEQFESWIINWELKYARSALKERQEIENRQNLKAKKVLDEQAKIDALPECVKEFLKDVEVSTIAYIIEEERIREARTKELLESYKAKGERIPRNFLFFRARAEEDVVKQVKKDVKYLALDFIARVDEKCGNIVDASLLRTAPSVNGTVINGFVKGDKGSAEVETIWAGGYNIQRLHCRVLVK